MHPSLPQRLVWLLAVPLGSAFVPWMVVALGDHDHELSWFWILVVLLVPLLGALGGLAYAWGAPLPASRWPLVPYLLAAVLFAGFVVHAMLPNETSSGMEGVPIVLIGFFQPLLALLGGVVSFAWVPRR